MEERFSDKNLVKKLRVGKIFFLDLILQKPSKIVKKEN